MVYDRSEMYTIEYLIWAWYISAEKTLETRDLEDGIKDAAYEYFSISCKLEDDCCYRLAIKDGDVDLIVHESSDGCEASVFPNSALTKQMITMPQNKYKNALSIELAVVQMTGGTEE